MAEHTTRTRRSGSSSGSSADAKPRRRANGEGSIYQTADGRWRAALTWYDQDRTRHVRTVSGKSADDVRRRLTKMRAELDEGKEPAGPLTVRDFLTRWLESEKQRVRPSSWVEKEQYVRLYFIPKLGKLPLAKLTPADVERMTQELVAAGKTSTAAKSRILLRRALSDAQRDGLAHRNVAALARPPRVEHHDLAYLDPAQLRALLAACEDHPLGPLVTVAAATGLRQGELLGLAWDDVDLGAGRLSVRHALARTFDGWALAEPKTSRSRRTIHLAAVAVAALRRQRTAQDALRERRGRDWQDRDGLVFTDDVGQPLKAYNVSAAFSRLLTGARLPHVPFHGLRHSAATAWLAAGVPLRVVADQLGHASIVITANTYAAVVPELRRDAADAMDRVLGGER